MKSSTIEAHINNDQTLNITHELAFALGFRISRWSWYNLRYWFLPPKLHSVAILPLRITDPLDTFDGTMFKEGGMFEKVPMNHYWRLSKRGQKQTFMLNCAAIANIFLYSEAEGYKSLKEAMEWAYEANNTNKTTGAVQAAGSLTESGDTCVLGGPSGKTGEPGVSSDSDATGVPGDEGDVS